MKTTAIANNATTSLILVILMLITPLRLVSQKQNPLSIRLSELQETIFVGQVDTTSFTLSRLDYINGNEPIKFEALSESRDRFTFDTASFQFKSLPSFDNFEHYLVDFQAIYPDTTLTRSVFFIPKLSIPPEYGVISHQSFFIPNAASLSHYNVSIEKGSKTTLNHIDRETKIIKISGGKIVVAPGQPIMDFNQNQDIERLEIYADSLVIGDTLHLPETDITIKARVIVFQDSEEVTASIITTPRSLAYKAENAGIGDVAGADGLSGLNSGKISLFSEQLTISSNNLDAYRLITNGGNGQSPGEGLDGTDGASMRNYGNNITKNGIKYSRVYRWWSKRTWSWGWKTKKYSEGAQRWPGDGQNSVPAGKPGEPGNAAAIYSNHSIASLCSMNGGLAGIPGESTLGGAPGSPANAYWEIAPWNGSLQRTFHTSVAGSDSPAPFAEDSVGNKEQFMLLENPYLWINTVQMRRALTLGKEAFIEGNANYTYSLFKKYLKNIDDLESSEYWDLLGEVQKASILAISQEMRVMNSQIDANLDYFGNPEGWTPYLTFEYYIQLYNQEVDRVLNEMYLAYLIESELSSIDEKRTAALAMKDLQLNGLTSDYNLYLKLNEEVPSMALDFSKLQRAQDSLNIERERIDNYLRILAERTVKDENRLKKIKQIASLAGKVASFIPGFQSVGAGLTAFSELDLKNPSSLDNAFKVLDGIEAIRNASDNYNSALPDALEATAGAYQTATQLRLEDYTLNKNYRDSVNQIFKKVKETSKPLVATYEEIQNSYRQFTVSDRHIQAELERLRSSSPEFNDIIDAIYEVVNLQRKVYEKHQAIRLQIEQINSKITGRFLAIDKLNHSLSESSFRVDPELSAYINEMRSRAEESLLRYHYLCARSYEYRLLEKYPGRLDISSMYNQIQNLLVSSNSNTSLSREEFLSLRGIYDNQIATIISSILNNYQFDRKSSIISIRLSPYQLKLLNERGVVNINPIANGSVFPDYEDVRILDVAINSEKTKYSISGGNHSYLISKINIQHSGVSKLVKNGIPYIFFHTSIDRPNPHTWAGIIDAVGGRITTERPSPLDESLLRAILEVGGHTNIDIMLFSSPGANSEFIISKTTNGDNGTDLNIEELVIDFTFDYGQQSDEQVKLEIKSNIDKPVVFSETQDLNGKGSGYASFTRFYEKSYSKNAEFRAQENFGKFRFSHWSKGGYTLSTEPTIKIGLYENSLITANYKYYFSDLEIDKDTIYLEGNQKYGEIKIRSVGTDQSLSWDALKLPEWITISIDSIEQKALIETQGANMGTERRVGKIVIANRNEFDDMDSVIIVQDLPNRLRIPVDTLFLSAAEGIDSLYVDSFNSDANILWEAEISGAGFSLDGHEQRTGSQHLIVQRDKNRGTEFREGLIMLRDDFFRYSIVLVQEYNSSKVYFEQDSLTLPESSGTLSVSIFETENKQTEWFISVQGDGLTVNPNSGVGASHVQLQWDGNKSGTNNFHQVIIDDGLSFDTLNITQKYFEPYVDIVKDSINLPSKSGIIRIDVNSLNGFIPKSVTLSESGFYIEETNLEIDKGFVLVRHDENNSSHHKTSKLIISSTSVKDSIILIQGHNRILSIDNQSNNMIDIVVYPNPSENYFKIDNNSITPIDRVVLRTIDGRIYLDENKPEANKLYDISNMKAGLYLVQINIENEFKVVALLKN